MLKVKGLEVFHPTGQEIVDVNFSIGKGEVLAVIGKNDSSKSLLGRVIADAAIEHKGQVVINHTDRRHDKEHLAFQLGYSPAESKLEEYLTGYEQLDFIGSLLGVDPSSRASMIVRLAKDFNISSDIYRLIEVLPVWSRKKISLIASLIHQPNVVVWDEPTTHLDPTDNQLIKQKITQLKDNKVSLLLISNDLGLVEDTADKIVVFDEGRIVAHGNLKELKNLSQSSSNSLSEIMEKILSKNVRS